MESAGLLACLIVRCCMVLFLFLFLACTCCFALLLRVSASSESCPQPPPPLTWRSRHVVSVKAFAIFPLTPPCATTTSTHVIKGRRLVLLAAGSTEDAKGELLSAFLFSGAATTFSTRLTHSSTLQQIKQHPLLLLVLLLLLLLLLQRLSPTTIPPLHLFPSSPSTKPVVPAANETIYST